MEFGRVVTCDVCLPSSAVCRGTTTEFDLLGDRVRIRTIGFDESERWTGIFGESIVLIVGELISGGATIFFLVIFVDDGAGTGVVWLSFILLRNVLLKVIIAKTKAKFKLK